MKLAKMHHLAIICRDEQKAKDFYINKLGFELLDEHHRPEKKDVLINIKKGEMVLELFIKPNAPKRVSGLPLGEACGLRHLAFKVADVLAKIDAVVKEVESADIKLPAGATFDDLVKALPASVKASIKANVEAAAKTLGLKVVITSAGITLVSGNNTAGNISTGSPVKQTGANYVASVVAAASLLVVAAGAFVVGKKAKLA